jgi:predicted nucleic acid-binding protein
VIVLDTSAVIELLLGSGAGRQVAHRVQAPEVSLHAPHLLTVEVTQVLRRLTLAGTLDDNRAHEALTDLGDLDVAYYDHQPLVARMWVLRDNLTAYDAAYVALAEVLRAPLLTLDRRLADAPGHIARVEVLGP